MCELDRCYEMNRDIDVDAEEPQPLPGGAGGGAGAAGRPDKSGGDKSLGLGGAGGGDKADTDLASKMDAFGIESGKKGDAAVGA